MILYYTDADESIIIGIFSVDREASSISKIACKILGYDFVEAESDVFDEVGDFSQDTVIVSSVDFVEEMLEFADKEIRVYLV